MAVPIDQVRETIELRPITPVFRAPACITGLVNLRGEILAILDIAQMLGLGVNRRDESSRVVVVDVEVEDQLRSAGLLVDGLGPIRDIPEDGLSPAPSPFVAADPALIDGVVSLESHPLAVLDIARVLDAPVLAPFIREG